MPCRTVQHAKLLESRGATDGFTFAAGPLGCKTLGWYGQFATKTNGTYRRIKCREPSSCSILHFLGMADRPKCLLDPTLVWICRVFILSRLEADPGDARTSIPQAILEMPCRTAQHEKLLESSGTTDGFTFAEGPSGCKTLGWYGQFATKTNGTYWTGALFIREESNVGSQVVAASCTSLAWQTGPHVHPSVNLPGLHSLVAWTRSRWCQDFNSTSNFSNFRNALSNSATRKAAGISWDDRRFYICCRPFGL